MAGVLDEIFNPLVGPTTGFLSGLQSVGNSLNNNPMLRLGLGMTMMQPNMPSPQAQAASHLQMMPQMMPQMTPQMTPANADTSNRPTQALNGGLVGNSQAMRLLRLLNGEGSIGMLPWLHQPTAPM